MIGPDGIEPDAWLGEILANAVPFLVIVQPPPGMFEILQVSVAELPGRTRSGLAWKLLIVGVAGGGGEGGADSVHCEPSQTKPGGIHEPGLGFGVRHLGGTEVCVPEISVQISTGGKGSRVTETPLKFIQPSVSLAHAYVGVPFKTTPYPLPLKLMQPSELTPFIARAKPLKAFVLELMVGAAPQEGFEPKLIQPAEPPHAYPASVLSLFTVTPDIFIQPVLPLQA